MLASCFTPPQNINTLTLSSGASAWYHKKNHADENWLDTRLVSSLRQHTQWKHSPAFGHQARNNSAASLWPERDDALSREALLAEQVSFNRRSRQRVDGATRGSNNTKRRREGELSGEETKNRHFNPLRHHRRRLRKSEDSASSHRAVHGIFGPRPEALRPRNRVAQLNGVKVMRGLRVRNASDDGHRRSLEPVLRLEIHPVFVQPVKEFVMKRWRVFRSGSRKRSSISASGKGTGRRPDDQRVASSTSKDSIQLCRCNQNMTMTEGSRTSLGQRDPDDEASSRASAGRETILTNAGVSQEPTHHAQPTATSEPVVEIECSDENLPMEGNDHFPPREWVPRHRLPSSESGQTRERTSMSGTTVYNPPLIAEASPTLKKLKSDGSTPACTSRDIRDSKFLQEKEMVSAPEQPQKPM